MIAIANGPSIRKRERATLTGMAYTRALPQQLAIFPGRLRSAALHAAAPRNHSCTAAIAMAQHAREVARSLNQFVDVGFTASLSDRDRNALKSGRGVFLQPTQ